MVNNTAKSFVNQIRVVSHVSNRWSRTRMYFMKYKNYVMILVIKASSLLILVVNNRNGHSTTAGTEAPK